MRSLINALFIGIIIKIVWSYPGNYYITTKYDNIDLDSMMRNERLINAYTKCLLNKGGCTPDGIDLKKALPDAIRDGCTRCSEKQKIGSSRMLQHLIENKPRIFYDLEKMYDPTGIYRRTYCELAKKENIPVKACFPYQFFQ